MKATSRYRGHKIYFSFDKWRYCDTDKVISEKTRSCRYCKTPNTKEGHDPCLGTLPGIMNACCGHGNINQMYVQFLDSHCISGQDAKTIIEILKKEKK